MQVPDRFNRIYIGDSGIKCIQLDLISANCTVLLDRASLLKDVAAPDIFDPLEEYEPARLTFDGVRSVSCLEGEYCLNSTVIDFGAKALDGEFVEFYLKMTGGYDNETFIRTLIIVAQNFSLASAF